MESKGRSAPMFKTKAEAEAYCIKEVGISSNELRKVQSMAPEFRAPVATFYAIMRKEGVKMDKVSEIQRRDAFVRGYLHGLQVAAEKGGGAE